MTGDFYCFLKFCLSCTPFQSCILACSHLFWLNAQVWVYFCGLLVPMAIYYQHLLSSNYCLLCASEIPVNPTGAPEVWKGPEFWGWCLDGFPLCQGPQDAHVSRWREGLWLLGCRYSASVLFSNPWGPKQPTFPLPHFTLSLAYLQIYSCH